MFIVNVGVPLLLHESYMVLIMNIMVNCDELPNKGHILISAH